MNTRTRGTLDKALIGAAVVTLAIGTLLAFTASASFAQAPTPAPAEAAFTHEQMHQMMDAMHGEGFSERMHEAMPGSEEMMEQCVAMMNMMQSMMGPGTSGMMGSQNGMMGGRSITRGMRQ